MEILEVKNNLVRLSFEENDNPIIGRFIVLESEQQSYVAQIVNIKIDEAQRALIGRLVFTFSAEGVVDSYDGSAPSIQSKIQHLASNELLDLLQIEKPLQLGNLAQDTTIITIDTSVFEKNLTVVVDKNYQTSTFISNCIRQLFQQKEKSVVIDNSNLFNGYSKIEVAKDFKLPLNVKMIDNILENDLKDVNTETKAIIQDVLYEIQQYIANLENEFIPIDNLINVITNQYKETLMPELALLKNRLLKYRDLNIFANDYSEITKLKKLLSITNCNIIDISRITNSLQKEVIAYIHSILDEFDSYVYMFLPIDNDTSNKKLLNQIFENNHIFTTLFVPPTYKYIQELYKNSENMILFQNSNISNVFTAYNTLISKLNKEEFIIDGTLTYNVPFIAELSDLELDITLEDVLGDKIDFIPGIKKINAPSEPEKNVLEDTTIVEDTPVDNPQEETITYTPTTSLPEFQGLKNEFIKEDDNTTFEDNTQFSENEIPNLDSDLQENAEPQYEDFSDDETLSDDELDYIEDVQMEAFDDILEDKSEIPEDSRDYEDEVEDEHSQYLESENFDEIQEDTPVVPIYPADDDIMTTPSEIAFNKGETVSHSRYGRGIIEKIIKYGDKTLYSINFENVGRRLLDPSISELTQA